MKRLFTHFIPTLLIPILVFGNGLLYAEDAANKLNMIEIVISNLISRIESLEKRVNALEKKSVPGTFKTKKETAIEPKKQVLPSDLEEIGDGFFVRNVRFQQFGPNVLLTGEVANKSEKNYRFIKFILEIYDLHKLLIKKEEFTIPDLPKDSIKPFETMLTDIDSGLIDSYTIKVFE
ncbi:MAG: hypothetical protein ACUBOA_11505 [Candidatus Loosdrechtia sp.]|uniref:hypothetical protein n=1 Tax=Candidatus Loosdrechtia sp. TaxID=3101272 RepID=UPI003A798CF6|nr:MAG: hypothetical protein QY305_00310 [Candidatus Jettenia sp. AMX2]